LADDWFTFEDASSKCGAETDLSYYRVGTGRVDKKIIMNCSKLATCSTPMT
jgi:hypothetical protein